MSLQLDDFLVTGRTYGEYEAFFGLTSDELAGKRVLDCPSGASSFVAQARERGIDAVGCDLLYDFDVEALRVQGARTIAKIYEDTRWMEGHNFAFYGSLAGHRAHREGALARFAAHYNPQDYRYAKLPTLPYTEGCFDLVLSSHLLFVYDDRLDWDFHEAAIAEMLRVGREVRLFPLVDYKNSRVGQPHNLSPYAYRAAEAFGGEILPVGFEFQPGAGSMLRIKRVQ